MDARSYFQQQFATALGLADVAGFELTQEQFDWAPPGTANTISAVMLHALGTEDYFIQAAIQGRPRLWESGGWAERIGVAELPGPGQSWDEFKSRPTPLEPVVAYGRAVRESTNAYLAGLTDAELAREIELGGRPRTIAEALTIILLHTSFHGGEISTLKGVQGARGIPF